MTRERVFELHHQALAAWCAYRRECAAPPALLTFDHHADNLPAFGASSHSEEERRARVAAFDGGDDAAVSAAVAALRHDEQIDLAVRSGTVGAAVILAHAPAARPNPAIPVIAPEAWPPLQTLLNDAAAYRRAVDGWLEDGTLAPLLERAGFVPEEHPGFILDLDFDGFPTRRSLSPRRRTVLNRLLRMAGAVTISLERDWQRLLRLDRDWDSDSQLAAWRRLAAAVTDVPR